MRTQIFTGFLLTVNFLLSPYAFASDRANVAAKAQILKIEKLLTAAWSSKDIGYLRVVMSDDFRAITSSGRVVNRDDVLAYAAASEGDGTDVSEEDVRIVGCTAIYTARIADHIKQKNGADELVVTRITNVFVRTGENWRLEGAQETLLK